GTSWDTEPYVTTYRYDQQSRLREVIDPLTDGSGVCTANPATPQTDECNATPWKTTYAFVAGNVQVTSQARNGATTTQWFDGNGRLVRERSPFAAGEADPTKGVSTYEYDLAGNLTNVEYMPATGETAIQATETEFRYDQLGRLRATIHLGTQPSFSAIDYFSTGDPSGDGWNVISFVPLLGSDPAGFSDPNIKNLATKTAFDSLGKPVLIESPDPGEVDHDHNVATPPIPADHGVSRTSISYSYVPDWLMYAVITEQEDAKLDGAVTKNLTTATTYNTRGQVIKNTAPFLGAAPPAERVTLENEYYATGQLKQSVDGERNVTMYLEAELIRRRVTWM
ncbi:MAG: hypothetical protein HYV60_03750, partial [Planctomycetia bacterium]|nr:hypothetical protein [Planctomycetia bacterium]